MRLMSERTGGRQDGENEKAIIDSDAHFRERSAWINSGWHGGYFNMTHEDRLRDLSDALADEKELQKCLRHGSAVFYDEPKCPACVMLREAYRERPPKKIWLTGRN